MEFIGAGLQVWLQVTQNGSRLGTTVEEVVCVSFPFLQMVENWVVSCSADIGTLVDIHREDQSTRSSGVLTCLCPRVELVTCVVTGMTSNMAAGIGINSLSIELPWRFVLNRRQERRIVADDECGGGRPTTCAAAPQLRGGPYHAANKSVTRHFWPRVLRQIE